ncbi:hypothetical protein KUTeg_002253 [Tegillarca granosa]|uniref:KY-like immunoglobulin-like domain-containing protein n=1 Tax=Tegillarca granosa TaxID=220873 RepID=A0ABQ9FX02_TEGGR|nr:hypothetical protein KUTeg_002253 [Tegillarca granosa]
MKRTGEYKLEIVGKDDTRIEENYSFDWIAIYKIIFNKSAVSPFPECPLIGWGPGNRSMFRCGLTSVSHNAGKIDTSTGSLEIKFERVNNLMPETSLIKLNYRGDLFKNGELYSMLNHVVHRVESNNFLFNVETPVSGEYAFKINALNEEGVITNICNYLIVSSQNKSNIPFPRDMHDRLGAKEAMKEMNIEIVTPKTAFIISDSKEEILFEFNKPSNVNLTAFVSCDDQHSFKPKIKQTFSEEKVIYKVKPGVSGNYGFRLRAVRGEGTLPQSVYDAVIKFSKLKKEKNIVPYEEKELKGLPEEIKTRIDKAMKHEDDNDLELIIEDIKLLTLSTKQEEIDKLEFDIQVIKCRKVLVSATMSKQILRMETALQRTCGKECVHRLEKEINALKAMLERTKKIARLLKDVMDLKQNVISEIKSYTKPPLIVHRNWSEVQKILSGTVRASIIRKVSKFDMDKISPDVAQKAKGYISDITLDDVRLISAGAATFYVWIKGVTEEIEKRRSEGQQSIAEFAENKNNVNGRSERNDNDQSDRDGRIETLYDVQSEHDEIEANDSKGGEFEDNLNFNGQNGTNDMENPEEQGNSNCNGKNDIDFDESEIIFENLDFKDLSVDSSENVSMDLKSQSESDSNYKEYRVEEDNSYAIYAV